MTPWEILLQRKGEWPVTILIPANVRDAIYRIRAECGLATGELSYIGETVLDQPGSLPLTDLGDSMANLRYALETIREVVNGLEKTYPFNATRS